MSEATQHAAWRRRRWRRAGWIGGGVVLTLALAIFVLPSPLARWAIGSQLESLGFEHEGLGTVEVDLWNSAVRAGPILMRADDNDPARLGAVDATYSLANLFERRAFIETFTLTGVEIHVRRASDGTITVNGAAPPGGDGAAEPEGEAEAGPGFGYGVATFVFADSRLVLEDYSGGALTLALDRLALSDFRSWEPETAGRYALSATLNGMTIRAEGEATPFAGTVRVAGDLALSDLTLDGVAAFVGPTGLARQAGRYGLDLRYDATLALGGALTATLEGGARAAEVALETSAGETLGLAALDQTLDATVTVQPDNSVAIEGAVETTLRDVTLADAAGGRATLAEATLGLSDMALRKSAELREGVAERAADAAAAAGGEAGTLVELGLRLLSEITRATLRHKLDGTATLTAAARGAEIAEANGARFSLASAEARAEGARVAPAGALWSIAAPLSLTLQGFNAESGGGRARLDRLGLDIDAFESRTDFVSRESRFDVALTLEGLSAEGGGGRGAVDGLTLRSEALSVSGALGAETVEGALTVEAEALSGGSGDAAARAEGLTVGLDAVRFAAEGGAVALSGRIDLSGLAAEAGGASAEAASLGVALSDVSATAAPLSLGGAAALSGSGVRLAQGEGVSASIGGVEARADRLSVTGGETAASGGASLSNLSVRLGRPAPVDVTLGGVEASGLALSLRLGGAPEVVVDTLALSGLEAEATVAAFGDASGGGASAGGGDGGPAPTVRLARLTVAPGGRLVIADSSAGEALRIPVTVERLEAGPFDTAAPRSPTTLDAAMTVADAGRLTVSGSAAPLAPGADFDLSAALEAFPVPMVSPYVTKLSGLTVESGELDLQASARASGGALDGNVDLRLAEFYVGEPDEETAARFRETYGVPVGFAVGVLKDGDGVIALSLPISGTVDAPEIDYGQVISKAIGGAIASLFPGGDFEGEAGFGIEPVPFAPGAEGLDEAGAAAVDRLAEALSAKPALRVRVCGKAARADLLALRGLDPEGPAPTDITEEEMQAMLALAQARGGALRQRLGEKGVAADRIGDCRTSYSVESDAPPRAEVQL